uniref:Uncharacterized protein n=1 Tax=Alexandrium monilatum TaxID=311494 RepID=A0A6T0YBH3_9DINO
MYGAGTPIPSYTFPVKVNVEGAALGEVDFKAYEFGVQNAYDGSTAKFGKVDAMTAAIRMRGASRAPVLQEEEVLVDSVKGPLIMGPDGRPIGSTRGEDTQMSGNTSKSYLACSKNWDQLTSTEKKIMLLTAAKKSAKLRESAEVKGKRTDPHHPMFNITRPYFDPRDQKAWQNAWTIPDN